MRFPLPLALLGSLACGQPQGGAPDLDSTTAVFPADAFDHPPLQLPPPAPAGACAGGEAAWNNGVPYATLQDAFDALVDQDVLYLCPGLHQGTWYLPGFLDVTLAGATGDPTDVVLDGGGPGPVAILDGYFDTRLTVQAFTLRDGRRGIDLPSWSSLIASDMVFERFTEAAFNISAPTVLDVRKTQFVGPFSERIVDAGLAAYWNHVVRFVDVSFSDIGDVRTGIDVRMGPPLARPQRPLAWDRLIVDRAVFEGAHTFGSLIEATSGRGLQLGLRDVTFRGNGDGTRDSYSLVDPDNGGYDAKAWFYADRVTVEDNNLYESWVHTYVGRPNNRIWVKNSTFHRNQTVEGIMGWNDNWVVDIVNTDFGTGPDANTPFAIEGCIDDGYVAQRQFIGASWRCQP